LEAGPAGIYSLCGGGGIGEDQLAVGGTKASSLVKRVAAAGAAAVGEGLEIGKLGISPKIVNQLAQKDITKLFPIQVTKHVVVFWDMVGRAKTGTYVNTLVSISSSNEYNLSFNFVLQETSFESRQCST
jgi:hypothetical protein